MNSIASFFAGTTAVLIFVFAYATRKPPEIADKNVLDPDDQPICARCLFPFEEGKDYCGACIYAWYPDGITRNQIEARVNAAHSQEK